MPHEFRCLFEILPPSSTVNFHLVADLVAGCSALWPLLGTLRNVRHSPCFAKWFAMSASENSLNIDKAWHLQIAHISILLFKQEILLRANRILGNYKKVSAITDYHSIPIQIRVSPSEIQLSTHTSFPKHGSSMNYKMQSTHTCALLIMEFLDSSLHRIIYSRPSAYRLPSVVPLQIDTCHSYPIFINFELFHAISASVSANYIHVSYWSVV